MRKGEENDDWGEIEEKVMRGNEKNEEKPWITEKNLMYVTQENGNCFLYLRGNYSKLHRYAFDSF